MGDVPLHVQFRGSAQTVQTAHELSSLHGMHLRSGLPQAKP
jgi:hypothetical protein